MESKLNQKNDNRNQRQSYSNQNVFGRVPEARPTRDWARYFDPEAQAEEDEVLSTPQDNLDSEACWKLIR